MDVFRVPVKSLVQTEEDEDDESIMADEERYFSADNDEDCDEPNGFSYDDDSPTSSSDEDITYSSRTSSDQKMASSGGKGRSSPYMLLKNGLEGALYHLFLPKRIPNCVQVDLVDIEFWILQQLSDCFDDVLRFPKLFPVSRMVNSWKWSQPKGFFDGERFTKHFSYGINEMEDNDTIPVYIRKQNCTILFTKLGEPGCGEDKERASRFKVETFRPCFPSNVIMSTIGSLQVTFPESSNFIYNTKMLSSEVFARQLYELSVEDFEVSMCTTVKAEREFLEYREVPDPFLITDWIVALLCPTSQYQDLNDLKVTKKIRDEVNCMRSAQAIPFRRSGLWTSVKVALQLKLLQVVKNENDARIIYKCLLLRFLSEVAHKYGTSEKSMKMDLLGQLMSKLGRRVKKLQKLSYDKKSNFAEEILYLWSTTLKTVQSVVGVINERMKSNWINECFSTSSSVEGVSIILQRKEDFRKDRLHDISWLNKFIANRSSSTGKSPLAKGSKGKKEMKNVALTSILNGKQKLQEKVDRYRAYDAIMGKNGKRDMTIFKLQIWRYDTENFVKFELDDTTFTDNSKAVLDLLVLYVNRATQPYLLQDNSLCYSQTVLVSLKLVQILDQMAVKRHPLLLQYKSGITRSLFDKLVLPHKADMLLLDKILDYFLERDKAAQFSRGGALDAVLEEISPTSFPCRFASFSEEMSNLRRKILDDVDMHKANKKAEVKKCQDECLKLRDEINQKSNSCEKCKLKEANRTMELLKGEETLTGCCAACMKLVTKLDEKRHSVSVYGLPLPHEEHLQNAVVFELKIPEEIKNLREALALFKFDVCVENQRKVDSSHLQFKWTTYKSISGYIGGDSEAVKTVRSGKEDLSFNLCSRVLPTSSTHHTQILNPDVLSPSNISDNEVSAFIVPNGLDCVYHYKRRNYMGHDNLSLTKLCTFQLSSCFSNVSKGNESIEEEESLERNYYSLQWALDSTNHSQNRVIAEFSSTYHPELVAFGSLRAGHRLQLMNLYRFIANRQLQLEKEPVVALVLQTLWEIGPRSSEDTVVIGEYKERESHLDFMNEEFTDAFLELLEKLLETNDTNYANPMILLNIVVITVRILELNEFCRIRCSNLLKKCRQCADSWLDMIQAEIFQKSEEDNRNCEDSNGKAEKRLRKLQLEISICSALSYNIVSEDLFPFVIENAADLLHWFQTLSRLHELSNNREKNEKQLLSPFGCHLFNMAKRVPLKLNLEGKLCSSPSFKDLFVKCLHLFSCEKWDWAAGAARWELSVDQLNSSNVVVGKYPSDVVTFDLLHGTFLVNGFARCGIPTCILENPLFELYFKRHTMNTLKVVQSQQAGPGGSVIFRTTDKFHGKHYEFELASLSKVTIREVCEETGTKLELLSPEKFQGILSDELVWIYAHWIDIQKKVVYFRKIPVQDADYLLPTEFTLTFDTTSQWLLRDEINQSYVLARKSKSFKTIAKTLARLELEKYINVNIVMAEGEEMDRVIAKLPRFHLTFSVESGHLLCKEYKNFKVSLNQNEKGTLIGLAQGLLLDNIPVGANAVPSPPLKRILLIPHGKFAIQTGKSGESHQKTRIDLTNLRRPPLFSYEFDPVLKRLKGDRSKSAWLYLAALHAATSSCSPSLVDPFTQLSGTEMAVQILQSGFVWSCSPYDEESYLTLKMIRRLAPQRQYYGQGLQSPLRSPKKWVKEKNVPSPPPELDEQMENTEWPHGIPSMVAYDGYAIIVDKLIEDSDKLSELHSNISGPHGTIKDSIENNKSTSSAKLQLRAYFRHLETYNKASVVSPHFFPIAPQKLNQNFTLPELLIRKRDTKNGKNVEEEKTWKEEEENKFNLDMLLRLSQARFVSTLEDPLNASHRKSDLQTFLLSPTPASIAKEELQLVERVKRIEEEGLLPAFPIPPGEKGFPLKEVLDCNFKENWLKFYQMAVDWAGTEEGRQAFTIVLSALAYQGAPTGQLLNLHNVSVLAETINFPALGKDVRTHCFSDYSSENDFSEETLKSYLTEQLYLKRGYSGERVDRISRDGDDNDQISEKLSTYEGKLEIEEKVEKIISEIKPFWPCERIPKKKMDELYISTEKSWSRQDFQMINFYITKWYRNFHLTKFIKEVEAYLDKFYEHFPNIPKHNKQFALMEELKLELTLSHQTDGDFQGNPFENVEGLVIEGDLDEPGMIFYSGSAFQESNVETLIQTQKEQCVSKVDDYTGKIIRAVTKGSSRQVILMTGLAPRMNPLMLLKCLIFGLRSEPGTVSPTLLKIVGALAVLWTELKRFNRILSLMTTKETSAAELKAELDNSGHENWSPTEYPEWLLLELELDIMIRPIQVDVAKQMMEMPDGRNGVMQLNMGEGKTSVIVPMICCSLSQKPDTLCRVTVLHSIFKTNLNLLSYAIGGIMLSRRIYTFPCRRDTKIEGNTLDNILQSYMECLKLKGVVLTLPEYRLSFRLLAFDKTLKSYPEIGVQLLKIENGLRRYCRDILDESDELLNVKYQLVYTIGAQVPVDGGSLRWITCQKVLQIVQDIAWIFLSKMGNSTVEFDKDQQQHHPEQFAHFRLLDQSPEAMEEFKSLIADEFLRELKLTERQKQIAKKLLTQERISLENFKFVMSMFKNDQNQLDEIRLLVGYIRHGILALALSKRWRVEYGVDKGRNQESQFRRMAVPFRAKDCPSEKTEFGHPDLAIVLTHLSYYYSGLSDEELEECFSVLKTKPEAESIYTSWVGRLVNFPTFLVSYSGINLEDAYQRTNLFRSLQKHKAVIDFWLSHKVFPLECKQFPGKISMSAWDLCYEKQQLPITGFSGTNDSSILLPLPISQQDLPQLNDTNRKMERTLLQPENGNHKGLEMGVTCTEILTKMKNESRRVLIDAGALMLELDNEQVAQLWLEVDPDIEAVVYFNKDNEMLVKCRSEIHGRGDTNLEVDEHGTSDKKKGKGLHNVYHLHNLKNWQGRTKDMPIELSPYRDQLGKCGVFLDDQHTRGVDLKFPTGSKACVTIGSRMRRDKLMQACMRMRQLGAGHTVTFYLSHEASSKILLESGSKGGIEITTQMVLKWVTKNTEEYNNDGLVYWALAGKNYAQKLAAQQFHDTVDTHPLEKMYTLAKQCIDDEILLLKDMYGSYMEAELLTKLIPQWFEAGQRKLQTVEGCYSLSGSITKRYDGIRDGIKKRIQENTPKGTCLSGGGFTSLEEEQEKEVEQEMEMEAEEERQVIRPKKMDYFEGSTLHENVKKTALEGIKISVKPGICRLSEIFSNTSYSKLVQPDGWSTAEAYATKDFISVVKENAKTEDEMNHFKTDAHLRPVEFVISIRSKPTSSNSTLSFKKSGVSASPTPLQILVISPFEANALLPYFRNGNAHSQLHMFSPRNYPNQCLLINNASLQVPRPLTLQSQNAPVLLNIIPDESKCLAALLVASGNLYFGSGAEQKTFAKFLGLVPRPWSAEQMNAFEKEMIKKSGFLLPKYRTSQMDSCQIDLDAFQKDPIPLVRKILLSRHAVISDMAHVNRLLNQNWFIELN